MRAFDVRTGKLTLAVQHDSDPGEYGNETWENDSWAINGNVGVWTQISVDEELGLVYLPVETPTSDHYGGHRPGNNLFAESLVCVDLRTGKRKWHFQFVHHPMWNLDMSSAPLLADINVNGRAIKAVAVPSKQNFLYVFDRVTGQPVWPIEERPVPRGDVPGRRIRQRSQFRPSRRLTRATSSTFPTTSSTSRPSCARRRFAALAIQAGPAVQPADSRSNDGLLGR